MLNSPFSPWPAFSEEEAAAVAAVLKSGKVNYWTGEECRMFECEFAGFAGAKYAVALANGTVALDLILKTLGIGPGDDVIVTPRTFIASVSCVVTAGATPVFADVDRDTQNITAETIAKVVTPRTKAVICVHLAGMPCDLDPILELAAKNKFKVIEDCAQAHGARYKDRSVGSIGHAAAWSFCQDKIMTTGGEGGMVTTNDEALWQAMWSYKDHGKSWDAVYKKQHAAGYRWLHESFGTNWRMIEMQAAIGRIQLKHMPEWHIKRQENAQAIWDVVSALPGLRVPEMPNWAGHAAYKCYVFAEPAALRSDWSRDRIVTEITAAGVPCYSGSCPEVYLETAFDNTGWRPAQRLPVAKHLGETSLMFLVHPTLTPDEISKTCDVLIAVLQRAAR
jgi:dTDP-4-amino-4,6-dideoxygalactose transaminase